MENLVCPELNFILLSPGASLWMWCLTLEFCFIVKGAVPSGFLPELDSFPFIARGPLSPPGWSQDGNCCRWSSAVLLNQYSGGTLGTAIRHEEVGRDNLEWRKMLNRPQTQRSFMSIGGRGALITHYSFLVWMNWKQGAKSGSKFKWQQVTPKDVSLVSHLKLNLSIQALAEKGRKRWRGTVPLIFKAWILALTPRINFSLLSWVVRTRGMVTFTSTTLRE